MIGNQGDAIPVEHLLRTGLPERLDGEGCRNVIAQGEIDFGFYKFIGVDFGLARMCGQDLFTDCHRHFFLPC